MLKAEFWWGGGGVVQSDFRVKPTPKVLLGWAAVAWLGFGVMTIFWPLIMPCMLGQKSKHSPRKSADSGNFSLNKTSSD